MFDDRDPFSVYGDLGCSMRKLLQVPSVGSKTSFLMNDFNKKICNVGVQIEWFFKEAKHCWRFVGTKRKLHMN